MDMSNQIFTSALFDQIEAREVSALLGHGRELHYVMDEVLDLEALGQQFLIVLEGSIAVCKSLVETARSSTTAESLKSMEL